MIKSEPMSSTIATASRKIRSGPGTRLPAMASTPRARAMSVATTIAQPRDALAPAMARYISAGTIMPPMAAATGRNAPRLVANCPLTNSRLISRPTTKKKIVINPSLTHSRRVRCRECSPTVIEIVVVHNCSYDDDQGELAQIIATTAAITSRTPPDASVRRKSRSGDRKCGLRCWVRRGWRIT